MPAARRLVSPMLQDAAWRVPCGRCWTVRLWAGATQRQACLHASQADREGVREALVSMQRSIHADVVSTQTCSQALERLTPCNKLLNQATGCRLYSRLHPATDRLQQTVGRMQVQHFAGYSRQQQVTGYMQQREAADSTSNGTFCEKKCETITSLFHVGSYG